MTTTKKAATKGNRSENLNLRFDPRLKYLAGIQARNERRTLSNLIENAVEAYLTSTGITTMNKKESLLTISAELWAIAQGKRFIMLAERFPFLLTFEEEYLWEIIQERGLNAPHRGDELEAAFSSLQKEAIERADKAPIVTIGGFPF